MPGFAFAQALLGRAASGDILALKAAKAAPRPSGTTRRASCWRPLRMTRCAASVIEQSLSTILFHDLQRDELCTLRMKDARHSRRGVPHLRVRGGGRTFKVTD